MTPTFVTHLDEESLERYSLNRLPEAEVEALEEHLLACEHCQQRLDEMDEFLAAARSASNRLRHEEASKGASKAGENRSWRAWFPLPVPAVAGGLALAAALAVTIPRAMDSGPAQVVALSAFRGEGSASVAAGKPVILLLDLAGIDGQANKVEVADASGRLIEFAPAAREVRLKTRLRQGQYWVRVYNGERFIREFGLAAR